MSAPGVEHWFYHLERSGVRDELPKLLEKSLARGWRAFVRAAEQARVDELDDWLWTYRDDAFLPHGRADRPLAERQPVLLSVDAANRNSAEIVFLLDGAPAIDDFAGVERCVVLFDGRNAAAVALARERWSGLKASGAALSYWRQTASGGWEKRG